MYKILSVSLILIFLPVCASFGSPNQLQGFQLDGQNGLTLVGGPLGAIQNTNLGVVNQTQAVNNPYQNVTALQTENGSMMQGAYAAGLDGVFGAAQVGNIFGAQEQATNGNLSLQDQVLNAGFAQDVAKLGGIGAVLGLQAAGVIQAQIIVTPKGATTNAQYLALGMTDSATGL